MTVADDVVAEIGVGALVLLGVASGDTATESERLAGKIARLRIFEDEDGRFDRSLLDIEGEALVVSQFTLIADTRKGNRPSFTDAADPELARRCTSDSAKRSRRTACASRAASSARACRSRSSTTAP